MATQEEDPDWIQYDSKPTLPLETVGVFNYNEQVEQEYVAEERQQQAERAKTWQKVHLNVHLHWMFQFRRKVSWRKPRSRLKFPKLRQRFKRRQRQQRTSLQVLALDILKSNDLFTN